MQAIYGSSRSVGFLNGITNSSPQRLQRNCQLKKLHKQSQLLKQLRGGGFSSGGVMQPIMAVAEAEPAAPVETFQYEAEVDRLMQMIVNSLYSNRDIFLRELISNASDALDKQRYLSLTDSSAMEGYPELEVLIKADPEAKTISIQDSGVGMTKAELIENLGTIARSGTQKFLEAMKEAQENNLIGQFGVGFYSSFLVADRVKVQSKSNADDKQWVFESEVNSKQYSIKEDTEEDIKRGTKITLFLKEDAEDYASDKKIADLIKEYSQFISFPIKLFAVKREYDQVVDEEATAKKQSQAAKKAEEEGKEAEKVPPVMKSEGKDVWDWRVQNENKPLWARDPKEVTKEEYDQFYKQTFKEFMDPMAVKHFSVEGMIVFDAMLFIPGMAPFDQDDFNTKSTSMKLFVKRVFISDQFDEDLLPRYLRFIKGIIDSSDLPLNVSREILQESRIVGIIKKSLVKRCLDMLTEIRDDDDKKKYESLWQNFGRYIKTGIVEEQAANNQPNKERLASLLQFYSSKSGDNTTSLDEYLQRKKEGQKTFYYVSADNKEQARNSPFVERLMKRDVEVLYLVEPIDEVMILNLTKYKDLEFTDVSREEVDLDDDEDTKKEKEEKEKELDDLLKFMKNTLGDRVEKVSVSTRLEDSPCILVTSKFGWSANMERIMRAQQMSDQKSMEYMKGKKIMEVNPDHEMIIHLQRMVRTGQELQIQQASGVIEVIYQTSLLTSGFSIEDPKVYSLQVYSLMAALMEAENSYNEPAEAQVQPTLESQGQPMVESQVQPTVESQAKQQSTQKTSQKKDDDEGESKPLIPEVVE
eukprot:TRINITY_DN2814_c1_g2_i2.p1 TRINITY_DN2814_c1_g2~~TRINITY_DN2814_c1_g2_i2.p1  ORF type:complete len:845 (-),score=172.46 TRINITY_DN2814_c1_g2_i2:616-3051(-)